jgi:hypothetical protein
MVLSSAELQLCTKRAAEVCKLIAGMYLAAQWCIQKMDVEHPFLDVLRRDPKIGCSEGLGKHTRSFKPATHKHSSNIAAFAPHGGKNWRSELCALHGALM